MLRRGALFASQWAGLLPMLPVTMLCSKKQLFAVPQRAVIAACRRSVVQALVLTAMACISAPLAIQQCQTAAGFQ